MRAKNFYIWIDYKRVEKYGKKKKNKHPIATKYLMKAIYKE